MRWPSSSHFCLSPQNQSIRISQLTLASFKVFIPLIIQRLINSRHIGLEHAYVSIKSSDTIEYSANATVKSPLPVRVGNLQFILRDPAVENPPTVITSNIDGFPVARSARIEIVDRVLNINNTDGLVQWADKFIDSDERPFDVDVKDLGIYLGKLHYKGNVKLPVVVNGLQGLKDITLEKLKLNLKPADGKNVKATVSLSNPSSLSVAVGNLTIALRVNGIDIGNAYTYNLFLVPGRNLVDIDGLVDIPAILNNIGLIIGSQMQSIQNGSVHAELKVTKFVVDGKEIEFLQTLLKDRVLDVRVPIVRLLDGAVTGVLKSGMLGTGQLNGTDFGSQTILGAVGDVLANKTLINRIGGHWNRRKLAKLQLEAL